MEPDKPVEVLNALACIVIAAVMTALSTLAGRAMGNVWRIAAMKESIRKTQQKIVEGISRIRYG